MLVFRLKKSKHSIVKLSVDLATNLTDVSILSNYDQASVRRRRNLTSVIPRSSAEILALDCKANKLNVSHFLST